jgi:tripartite-type tricarboxylate transporter receptor subunit TctC
MTSWMRGLGLALALVCGPAFAQDWKPTKPVRLVVPIQGGTVDVLARIVAPRLQQLWGQPVIVDARPGAGGNIGTEAVVKSEPDGHTLLVAFTAPITVNPTLFAGRIAYDPLKDLAPITLAVTSPQLLTVHPSVPANDVREFVRHVRQNPGRLSYASVSIGSASHLTMEMLKTAAGIDLVHVPYKGSAPAVTDLMAGQVQAAVLVPGNVLPHLPGGKLKVIGSTGGKRFRALPEVPTVAESGYDGFEAVAWIGFMAPAGTPRPVIDTYHREIVRILALPEVRKQLEDISFEIVASTPEGFAEYIRWETPRWAKVIRDNAIKPE